MTLTLAGRFVVMVLTLVFILILIGVAARVWAGQWDAKTVAAVVITAPTVVLLGLMAWRWDA